MKFILITSACMLVGFAWFFCMTYRQCRDRFQEGFDYANKLLKDSDDPEKEIAALDVHSDGFDSMSDFDYGVKEAIREWKLEN